MRASSPNRPALGFSQLRNQSSPPLPRPQNASLMASPPRFQSAIISGSPSRTQNAFMPRIGGTATEGLRREKEALQAEIENVKRMCHGLQVQYENMKMEHQATSEDYDKLRQEIQVLRRDQAELGWDHGHLKLENQGFKKMKGEILEEDATQARAYENMTKEVAQLKQKLKELDLIERRRKYDAQVSDLEATLRHAQSRVDSMYSNPHSRIGHETLLDVDRSRTGYIDRPLTTLLPAGLLSPKGLGDGSVRVDAFLSPRVQREPLINPTRISPIKNPLHERKQEVVMAKEVVYASPPKAGTLSRVLASPSVHYDENRLSIIQPQVIHPVTVNQVIQPQHVPNIPISQVIHSGPVNHVIQPQVVPMGHVIQPGVVDHGHMIMNNPVEIVEAPIVGGPMVGREPSIFEKPFAFPNKYSKVAGNPPVQYI